MQNNISARNIACLICVMVTSSVLMGGGSEVGQDVWISVLAAIIMAIPLGLLYSRIASLNPGLNFFDMVYQRFGKIGGAIAAIIISFWALHIVGLLTRNFSEFVVAISLENTPKVIVDLGIIGVGAYLARTNFKVMGKWGAAATLMIMVYLFITILLALPTMTFSHIRPVFEHSITEILSSAFAMGAISFAETALMLCAVGNLKKDEKPVKAYMIGIIFGGISVLAVVLRNVTVLGRGIISTSIFPSYITARIIKPGQFIEHIESIVSFNLILIGITKAGICLKAASLGAAKLLKADDKKLMVPLSLAALAISVTTFSNMEELIVFLGAYKYYVIPAAIVIPLLLWIVSEVKNKRQAKNM